MWIGIVLELCATAIVRLDAQHPDRPFIDHSWLEACNRVCVAIFRVPLADILTVVGLPFALVGATTIGLRWFNRIGSTKT